MPEGLRIWRQPRRGEDYVWGGDVAQGLEHGDNSALEVLCLNDGHQVAEYQGKMEPSELGELAYLLGQYYNWAFGCFENNADLTPQSVCAVQLKYPNYYYQQTVGSDVDTSTRKYGWNTNMRTRYLMINDMRSMLADGSLTVRSSWLLDEMEIFARSPRGKYEAIPGGHDDLVMAYAIAVQMFKYALLMRQDEEGLQPLVDGQMVRPGEDDIDEPLEKQTREARIAAKVAAERTLPEYVTSLGNLL